jgi:hypothetical protein
MQRQNSGHCFARRFWRLAAAIVAMSLAAPAWANYVCQGTIDSVALNTGGTVTVQSTAAGLYPAFICAIGTTVNGVGPEQCKAILAMLITARTSGQQVQWYFSDGLTCTTHPAWAWLSGWYHGPVLMD